MAKTSKEKKERIESDYYPSPVWTIDALMNHIDIHPEDVILEPAMGDGRILDRFPKGNEHKWAEISNHRDYLNPDRDYTADVIITNPPYSLAKEFISTALERDLKECGTCCMLLRVGVLGSAERSEFWRSFPFTTLAVLSPRPCFVHGASDNSEYAWFIWDYGNRFKTPALWTFRRAEHDPDYVDYLRNKEARSEEIKIEKAEKEKRIKIAKEKRERKQRVVAHSKEMIEKGSALKGKKLLEEAEKQINELDKVEK